MLLTEANHNNQYRHLGKGAIADMIARGIPHNKIGLMGKVSPEHLSEILREHGWKEISSQESEKHVWQKVGDGNYHQVTIPSDETRDDFADIMTSTVYSVYLHDGISLDDLLGECRP